MPPGDPTKSKLLQQVEEGRKQKQRIKTLRAAVKDDMKAKVWSDADRDIAKLLALVPGDPEAMKWKKGSPRNSVSRTARRICGPSAL